MKLLALQIQANVLILCMNVSDMGLNPLLKVNYRITSLIENEMNFMGSKVCAKNQ